MNKKICLLPLLLLAFVFVSCEETKEVSEFDNWRARNEAFMDSIQHVYDTAPDHGGLEYVVPYANPTQKVFYKNITPEGTEIGDVSPIYTQTVTVYYRGSYVNGSVFAETFSGKDPTPFDTTASFVVGQTLWVDVLQQRMKVGQRYMMYIPWQMGYGADDYTSNGSTILGYSSLIFDVVLVSIDN